MYQREKEDQLLKKTIILLLNKFILQPSIKSKKEETKKIPQQEFLCVSAKNPI